MVDQISRRSVLLQGAVCATGAAAILAADVKSARAAKVPQKTVNYQDSPKGDQQCSNCSLFEAPNACKNVDGEISPKGWCSLWRKG